MAIMQATTNGKMFGTDYQYKRNNESIPVLAIDAIAAEVGEAITGSRGDITGYNWTPLSSYLGEMRTKIAKHQLFD